MAVQELKMTVFTGTTIYHFFCDTKYYIDVSKVSVFTGFNSDFSVLLLYMTKIDSSSVLIPFGVP